MVSEYCGIEVGVGGTGVGVGVGVAVGNGVGVGAGVGVAVGREAGVGVGLGAGVGVGVPKEAAVVKVLPVTLAWSVKTARPAIPTGKERNPMVDTGRRIAFNISCELQRRHGWLPTSCFQLL